jgi:hypothetical protein
VLSPEFVKELEKLQVRAAGMSAKSLSFSSLPAGS